MRFYIDEKNRRVIATGNCKGRRIKAIAVCNMHDEFDAEIGKKVATTKYKIRELKTKQKIHQSNIKKLHNLISWCFRVIEDETKITNGITERLLELEKEDEKYTIY